MTEGLAMHNSICRELPKISGGEIQYSEILTDKTMYEGIERACCLLEEMSWVLMDRHLWTLGEQVESGGFCAVQEN